ncbi:hypothetical protein [Streptomyces laurentii]|uniref:hypothetical protein n=1 Tax=Streptomyces laurentii TaxID=39478 RepID=UPI003401065C
MTVKSLIARPLVWLCAHTDVLIVLLVTLGVAGPLSESLVAVGVDKVQAYVAVLPVGLAAGFGAGMWWVHRPKGRRSFQDIYLELADRIADWAGWTTIHPET